MTTLTVYGLAKNETKRYMEDFLAECESQADVWRVIEAAAVDGFHSFRVSNPLGSSTTVDFAECLIIN